MKVLVDTNVVLDIALNRKPFVEHAAHFTHGLARPSHRSPDCSILGRCITEMCQSGMEKTGAGREVMRSLS